MNIIKILSKFKIFKYHRIRKFLFSDLFIPHYLPKIILHLCLQSRSFHSLIFSSLKKSSFLKSMLLLNFLIRWSSNWKKNHNNSMIFKLYYSMIFIRCYYLVSNCLVPRCRNLFNTGPLTSKLHAHLPAFVYKTWI